MTFWKALVQGGQIVGVVGSVLGLMIWTTNAWFGEWWEKIANVAAWVLVVSVIIWLIGYPGEGPA